jgi:hypothetical protein
LQAQAPEFTDDLALPGLRYGAQAVGSFGIAGHAAAFEPGGAE